MLLLSLLALCIADTVYDAGFADGWRLASGAAEVEKDGAVGLSCTFPGELVVAHAGAVGAKAFKTLEILCDDNGPAGATHLLGVSFDGGAALPATTQGGMENRVFVRVEAESVETLRVTAEAATELFVRAVELSRCDLDDVDDCGLKENGAGLVACLVGALLLAVLL